METQWKISGTTVLREVTESKEKLGSPGDQKLGNSGKKHGSRSQILSEV